MFGPVSIADLFLKLHGDDQDIKINNPYIWIQSNDELRENVKNIIFHFKIYNYLITSIKLHLNRLVQTQFINNIVEELKTKYRNDSIKFNYQTNIIACKNGKVNL